MRNLDTYISEGFYKNTGSTQFAQAKKITEKVQTIHSKLVDLYGEDYDGMNFVKAFGRTGLCILLEELKKYPDGTGFKTQFSEQGKWCDMTLVHDFDDEYTFTEQYTKSFQSKHTHTIDERHLGGLEDLFCVDLKLPFEAYVE